MAPALVEHSAQERNSSSKYLEKLSCIPPIVLVDSIKRIESKKLLTSKLFSTVMVSEKERLVEKGHSHLVHNPIQSPIPQANRKCFTTRTTESKCLSSKINREIVTFTDETRNRPSTLINQSLQTISLMKPLSNATPTINSSLLTTVTDEERTEQPVAKYDKKELYSLITQSQTKILNKSSAIEKDYSILNSKVNNFRLHNAISHMNTNMKAGGKVSSSNVKINEIIKVPNNKKVSEKKMKVSSKPNKQQLCESNLHLGQVYDSLSYLTDEDTDHEENFDLRVKVPVGRGKRKSEKPLPTPLDLCQWKENRCYVGSQCSWLSLRIDTLDKKISSLHKVYKKLKSERQSSKTLNFEQLSTKSKVVNQETTQHNLSSGTLSATSLNSQDETHCGSSRTSFIKSSWQHKYIKKPEIESLCDQFKCRNSTAIYPCQSCWLTLTKTKGVYHDVQNLDASFHERLSYETDTTLPLLLEKTLREEKINTKVTITKSTKKKKKLKSKEILSSVEQQKNSNSKLSRKNEKRSDEFRRKRSSTEGTGRVRKIRKLSDSFSYDSSKPSTPTNELVSPLSQSLNASAGFKNKKKSTGDYDINNIVIPYSMAASTRVERIQYKEIPTPGWRNIDFEFDERNRDEDPEYTDDESFMERHARCEILERKRFTNFFHLSMNRRRPRTSEGPNSQPPSPLVIDDLCSSNAGTPADSPSGLNSSKNNSINIQSYTEEERDPPWTPRDFPLENEDLNQLSTPNTSEDVHKQGSQSASFSVDKSNTYASLTQVSQKLMETSSTASNTPMASPLLTPSPSFSSPSTPGEVNSNWTVKVVDDKTVDVVTTDKLRKGIVLKLAKK